MKNISLQNIRWENNLSIFRIIAEEGPVSRSEITDRTGLSLMTVGKTADLLLENNAVRQTKEAQSHAGRRAGSLAVREDLYLIVFDFSDPLPRCEILDLCLRPLEQFELDLPPDFYDTIGFAEGITVSVESVFLNHEPMNCCGIGICLPVDSTIKPSDIDLSLDAFIGTIPFAADFAVNAAARSFICQIDGFDEQNILYCFVKHESSAGAYFVDGEPILGLNGRFCDFGKIRDRQGDRLSERLNQVSSTMEYTEILSSELAVLLRILAPHTVLLDCSFPVDPKLIADSLMSGHGFTENELPKIVIAESVTLHTCRGIAMMAREAWLKGLLTT